MVVLTQHSLSADDVHDDVDDNGINNGINKGHPNISTLFVMFFVVIKRKIFIITNTSVTGIVTLTSSGRRNIGLTSESLGSNMNLVETDKMSLNTKYLE